MEIPDDPLPLTFIDSGLHQTAATKEPPPLWLLHWGNTTVMFQLLTPLIVWARQERSISNCRVYLLRFIPQSNICGVGRDVIGEEPMLIIHAGGREMEI